MLRYHRHNVGFGSFIVCDWCGGKHYVGDLLCPKCEGAGRIFLRPKPESDMHLWSLGTILLLLALVAVGYLFFAVK